ncbi:DUF1521 domain-containing protein [Sphingobium sp. BYY-5]|uniref:DUF1521 domain-containing protein n=1 Tax=Sphingobium sp. BYY-5 TaxID=2926400 RepID=UPI001FA794D5|nr:DUF1521 domain-containing protein [Sphingobium sp. BYY-5]MCI4592633.1 DUF1521 domain-containing protein [Sphingobium sp. BYY-5]
MTTINNSFNLNFAVNNFNAAPAGQLGANMTLQLAAGIMGSYFQPLMASAFASATLPMLFQMQGGTILPGNGGQTPPSFTPTPGATWTASLKNESEGTIDLGDGYSLELDERNSEIRIYNEETGETTRIWGDPHVDIDGKHAFDFWGTTTFELENGTKITIGTEQFAANPNEYVASKLTITKGDQAIVVDGISQNEIGDLSISMSNNGRALDAQTRDGFVLEENANGAGWRSELTGNIATQADLDMTKVGAMYGPGSDAPSLGEISQQLSSFLLFGFINALTNAALQGGLSGRA